VSEARGGRPQRDPLPPEGGGDPRPPQRDKAQMMPPPVPPPVTAVMDAASAWLPARMAEVEDRLAELSAGYGPRLGKEAEATLTAGGKRLRPVLVLMAAGGGARGLARGAASAVAARPHAAV